MKRYLIALIFSLGVVVLYSFVHIRLFSLDLTQRMREALFALRTLPPGETDIFLFNIGELTPAELPNKIDSLLLMQPEKLGINLCHFDNVPEELLCRYQSNPRVVFANCGDAGPNQLSQIVDTHNVVTHFKTDNDQYFEFNLTPARARDNDREMINFGARIEALSGAIELSQTNYWFNPEYLAGKTFLVGYIGIFSSGDPESFKNARTTPWNRFYGQGSVPPDMSDVEISYNIIRTLKNHAFINEIGPVTRISLLVLTSMLTVVIITFAKTRWLILNLIIATTLFVVLTGFAAYVILIAFDSGYYVDLDELPLILIVTIVMTVILNIRQKQKEEERIVEPL